MKRKEKHCVTKSWIKTWKWFNTLLSLHFKIFSQKQNGRLVDRAVDGWDGCCWSPASPLLGCQSSFLKEREKNKNKKTIGVGFIFNVKLKQLRRGKKKSINDLKIGWTSLVLLQLFLECFFFCPFRPLPLSFWWKLTGTKSECGLRTGDSRKRGGSFLMWTSVKEDEGFLSAVCNNKGRKLDVFLLFFFAIQWQHVIWEGRKGTSGRLDV